jgi:HK97 family phage portal protein
MGILAGIFGPSQGLDDPGHWLFRALGGGRTNAGKSVSEFSAMSFSAVYAAVGLIADSLAQLPFGVYQVTDKGTFARPQHPLHNVLRLRPNPFTSSFTWRQTGQHHVLLWGNGYSEIQRNNAGQAIGIWPLLPDRTYPRYSDDGESLIYYTSIDGKQVTLPGDDVLHVKAIGFDGLVGYSPLHMQRQAVGLAAAAEEFGSKFFANDAKSGGFLHHPGKLGVEAQKNLIDSMGKEGQGGLGNAHRIKVLEEGMKFVSTTIPPDDAQFLGTRSFQVEEIARFYRVPLVLMNSNERTSALGSSVEQLLQAFVQWTLLPWAEQWEQEANEKLFSEREKRAGFIVRFNMDALVRGDMAARGEFYKTLWNVGAINGNEIRGREGMNPDPDLDAFYRPLNFVRVGSDADKVQPQPGVQNVPTEPAENV